MYILYGEENMRVHDFSSDLFETDEVNDRNKQLVQKKRARKIKEKKKWCYKTKRLVFASYYHIVYCLPIIRKKKTKTKQKTNKQKNKKQNKTNKKKTPIFID